MTIISRRTFVVGSAAAANVALMPQAPLVGFDASVAFAADADELIIGIGVDPVNLDPRRSEVTEALSITHSVTEETLYRSDDGKIVPQLAESWSYADSKTLILKLRAGIKFTNGEPLDSAAVKYTLESVLDPANTFIAPEARGWFASIAAIEAPDAQTVVIKLKAPNHAVLSYLTMLGIVPPKAAAAAGKDFGFAPIGTGPFMLKSYIAGNRLELVANPNYRNGPPTLKKVTIRFIPEAATRVAALEAGEVHVINGVSPDVAGRIQKSTDFEVLSVPSVRTVFMAFMSDRPPFNNPALRKAIMHAIDRKSIVDVLLGGNGEVAQSVFAPGVGYFTPQQPYAFDPAQARKLITESGFDTKQTLKFAYPTGRTVNDRAVGEAVAGMLKSVGLSVEIEAPEWGTYLQNYQRRRIYDFVISSMAPANLNPDYALFPWFRSDTSFIKYSNPTADDLLKRGAEAVEQAEQEKIYKELQTFLWTDLGYGPLYVVPQLWAKSKRLTGFNLRRDSIWLFDKATVRS